jgi:DNA-binding CsgD family transcriptional regulator/tetratricopeptide (TPR) repeat protein
VGRRWPLVGRDDELELIDERLRTGNTAVLVIAGAAGVGKTRLATEALELAAAHGRETARVVASRSAKSVPFGAVAPLLPDLDRAAETPFSFLRRAARLIASRSSGRQLVLAVDDAHHLDDASATLIHQLAEEGEVSLLLTVRTGEPAPDAVSLLWKDGVADRLELQALAREELEALVREALGPSVHGALQQHLWSVSGGNPLYLRELIEGYQQVGALTREGDIWRLRDDRTAPPRLLELVEARIGSLDDTELLVLELLTLAETIGLAALEAATSREVLQRLESRGLVAVSSDDRRRPVRLAHPLYGEVLRWRMPESRARAAQDLIASGILDRGARRKADSLRVATLKLDAEGAVDVDLLNRALEESFLAYDLELTQKIARAGVAAGGGPKFSRLLAETLRWQGRHEHADELLSEIDLAQLEPEDAALIALTRAECLYRGLGRRHDAVAVLDQAEALVDDHVWRAEIRALVRTFDVLSGEVADAIPEMREMHNSAPAGRARVAAAIALSPALTMSGRTDEAIEVSETAFTLANELIPQPMMADPGLHMISRCLAVAYSGRYAEAEAPVRLGYEWTLTTSVLMGQSWFAMLLGLTQLGQGRLSEACRYFREGATGFRDLSEPGLRRWCLAGVAQASSAAGDREAAIAAIKELDAVTGTEMVLADLEVERARAWVEVVDGRVNPALDRLRTAAGVAASRGLFGLECGAQHDLVRLGEPATAAARLGELRKVVDGPLVQVRADHAAALAAGDGPALDSASLAFEELGALLLAAEAAAQAAAAHARVGRDRLATASRNRADLLRGRCDGARTPALTAAVDGAVAPLTRREREVAAFAAGGMPSKDIAQQLFLSVRTVENHLQRVYTKLGVSNRSELARALGSGGSGFE